MVEHYSMSRCRTAAPDLSPHQNRFNSTLIELGSLLPPELLVPVVSTAISDLVVTLVCELLKQLISVSALNYSFSGLII